MRQSNCNILPIVSVLNRSKSSRLSFYFDEDTTGYDDYNFGTCIENKWFLQLIDLENNSFDEIEMYIERNTDMYLHWEDNSKMYLDDLICNEFDGNMLNHIAKKFASRTIIDYQTWCKPLLSLNSET